MYEILMTNIQIRQQAISAEWTKIEIDLTSKCVQIINMIYSYNILQMYGN